MDKTTSETLNKYIKRLIDNNYHINEVYLFGSYLKGNYKSYSDIDLAIIMSHIKDEFNTQVELISLTWGIDTRIEPHLFDIKDFNSDNPFAEEIKRTGLKIW